MSTPRSSLADPLHKVPDGARIAGTDWPMPLIETAIEVRIRAGLAIVATTRRFRNAEARSIEATITQPVPVHATMTGLTVRIDGRTLVAKAVRRDQAREDYEAAIDAGRTAVLHEEALRGIHILSIGHIPPGGTIVVACAWAAPLTRSGDGAMLRIPLTVGEVYGRSPLSDSDDLFAAPGEQFASLRVHCEPEVAVLRDAVLVRGNTRVTLGRPIDLVLPRWMPAPLRGRAADGRMVTLDIVPADPGGVPVQAALLLDQSGSMDQPCAAVQTEFGAARWPPRKHDAMVAGAARALAALQPEDEVGLWQFSDRCEPVHDLSGLWGPDGGTQIGLALATIVRRSAATDIIVVTDGQSHDIDVQALARSGKRFTAVLIGEDSLEAHVGHLAALTGGEIFLTAGSDAGTAIAAAIGSLRQPHVVAAPIREAPEALRARIGGMELRARWQPALAEDGAGAEDQGVIAAVAAALAIPRMEMEEAARLAEAHGIVCHLTSLVMVDEAGTSQPGLPAHRKVPLMHYMATISQNRREGPKFLFRDFKEDMRFDERMIECEVGRVTLLDAIADIDWSDAEPLRQGATDALPRDLAKIILCAAGFASVVALASAVGAPPAAVVFAIMARKLGRTDRNAARLARSVLRTADRGLLAAATRDLGLTGRARASLNRG
jgi:hypothetical protein